jgi:hypothetical protein
MVTTTRIYRRKKKKKGKEGRNEGVKAALKLQIENNWGAFCSRQFNRIFLIYFFKLKTIFYYHVFSISVTISVFGSMIADTF